MRLLIRNIGDMQIVLHISIIPHLRTYVKIVRKRVKRRYGWRFGPLPDPKVVASGQDQRDVRRSQHVRQKTGRSDGYLQLERVA